MWPSYAHYVDKFDLLDQFEDEMFSKIAKASERIPEDISQDGFMREAGFKEYIASVLAILSESKELFAIMYDSKQGASFQKKIFAHLNAVWSAHHINEDTKADAEYVQIAAVGMCCALIEKWFERGCTPDIPEFSQIVSEISGSFAEGVLGDPPCNDRHT